MKALRHLNKYFYKYRYRLVLGMLFVIISNLFSAFPAKAVSAAVDELVKYLQQITSKNLTEIQIKDATTYFTKQVIWFALLIVGLTLLRALFMFLMRQSIIVMSRLIEYDLKNEVFAHYQILSASFYRKNNTGDLMARISEDVSRVRMYIGPAVMYFTNLTATFLVVIPIMFSVHAQLALWVLLPLPILSYTIFKVNNIINKRSDEIQQQLSVITNTAQETFNGIRVIKAFGAERWFKPLFITQAERYKDKNMELAKVDATFFPLMVFLTGCSTLIAVSVGGYYVLHGEITIGNIAEFVIYVNLLTWPVASLGWTSSLVQRAAASQQRLNEFLQEQPEIAETAASSFHFDQHIAFKGVSFTYPGKEIPALKNINITIEKGRTLAVLGTTGSGKSTFIQLLLRMMDCTQGDILIDGKSIKEIDLKAYKNKIGYVPQEVFLFSDTIKNNIAFGVDLNSAQNVEEQVVKAAKAAALHENVSNFTHGYETMLGERGITLSGGQKQRLSIARALIKNPEILILDDCLSAVDTHTEAEILQNLRPIMQDKTSFIVSHRVSTVKDADFIIVLHEGEIVESGNHLQLLQKQGIYCTLYNKQLLEETA